MMSTSQPQGLAALVHEFMRCPAVYVEPSWLPASWAEEFARRRPSMHARALQVVSQWLVREHALEEGGWNCESREPRIALIEAPALVRLARYVGIWRHARSIRAEVERTRVSRLLAALGQDGYAFALKCETPATPSPALPPDAVLDAEMLREGAVRLLAAVGAAPDAITRRMRLKLPRQILQSGLPALASEDLRETSAYVPRLIAQMEPQWALLF